LCQPPLQRRKELPSLILFDDPEVSASTLYETAALAIAEFRRCGFTTRAPGAETRLTVSLELGVANIAWALDPRLSLLVRGRQSRVRWGHIGILLGRELTLHVSLLGGALM
jgi:hypothetical protein